MIVIMRRFVRNIVVLFALCGLSTLVFGEKTCDLDITRIDLKGLNASCGDAVEPELLCDKCITFLAQRIVDAGYSKEELEELPLDSCATDNLSFLLEAGASIGAFLKVSQCPRTGVNIYQNVVFPSENTTTAVEDEDLSAIQKAFESVGDDVVAIEEKELAANEMKKDESNIDYVALSVCLTLLFVLFIAIVIFAIYRNSMKKKLLHTYVERTREEERENAPSFSKPILSFGGITCALKSSNRNEKRSIIENISGVICTNEVIAILGPSGCGKTTLIKTLISRAGFNVDLDVKKMNISGSQEFEGKNIGYVSQYSNNLLEYLTTTESIYYAAALRLPWYVPRATKEAKVQALLQELSLTEESNTRVGDLSGGQRRRLTIAMELVIDSDILFLDEPTSGLDTRTADTILVLLKEISRGGRAVCLSIHAPSAKSFATLDSVLLLSATGKCLFFEQKNSVLNLIERAELFCPSDFSVAEWCLEIAGDSIKSSQLLLSQQKFSDTNNIEQQQRLRNSPSDDSLVVQLKNYRSGEHSFLTEFAILFWREQLELRRNYQRSFTDSLTAIIVGVLIGVLYYDVDKNLRGFQNRMGSIFFILFFFALSSVSCVDSFLRSSKVYVRENRAGYYSKSSYVLTKLMAEIGFLRWTSVILSAIPFYWLMGLRSEGEAFLAFLGYALVFSAASTTLMAFLSTLTSHTSIATLCGIVCVLLSSLFGGFLINIPTLNPFVRWLRYFSTFFYAWGGMLAVEMKETRFAFDAELDGTDIDVGVGGETYLIVVGVDPKNCPRDAAALAAITVLYTILVIWRYRRFE